MAYGPEAIVLVLITAGTSAVNATVPVTLVIAGLLAVLVVSYGQVIAVHPDGGGAYAVAKKDLGTRTSYLVAASLVVDYVLTVAVSLAAGAASLASAFPSLGSHLLELCLVGLALLTAVNLPGVAESARVLMPPTALLNGVAALLISVAGVVLLASKFLAGAWVVVVAIPLLMLLFARIRGYYTTVAREVGLGEVPPPLRRVTDSLVLVPVGQVGKVTQRALSAARALGHEVVAVAVHGDPANARALKESWDLGAGRTTGRHRQSAALAGAAARRLRAAGSGERPADRRPHPGGGAPPPPLPDLPEPARVAARGGAAGPYGCRRVCGAVQVEPVTTTCG